MNNNILKNTFTAIVLMGILCISTVTHGQSIELNDPQIISVIKAIDNIDVSYGKIALKKSKKKTIKEFARNLVDEHSILYDSTIALENKLILSPQTNVVTRFLLDEQAKNVEILKSRRGKDFYKTYIDIEVDHHKYIVSIAKNILLNQARNKHLQEYLLTIYSKWESLLWDTIKAQDRFNK